MRYPWLSGILMAGALIPGISMPIVRITTFGSLASNLNRVLATRALKDIPPLRVSRILGGVTSHHIPTAFPVLAKFYKTLKATQSVDTFVIIGPDHFAKGKADITISKATFAMPAGTVQPNLPMIKAIEKSGLAIHDESAFADHSMHSQLLLINKLFPKARVVPIIIRGSARNDRAQKLGELLGTLANNRTVVIASVDFSHYLPKAQALPIDQHSAVLMAQGDTESAAKAETDSPQSLVAYTAAVKKMGSNAVIPFGYYNSGDFSQQKDYTTGWVFQFSVIQ